MQLAFTSHPRIPSDGVSQSPKHLWETGSCVGPDSIVPGGFGDAVHHIQRFPGPARVMSVFQATNHTLRARL